MSEATIEKCVFFDMPCLAMCPFLIKSLEDNQVDCIFRIAEQGIRQGGKQAFSEALKFIQKGNNVVKGVKNAKNLNDFIAIGIDAFSLIGNGSKKPNDHDRP